MTPLEMMMAMPMGRSLPRRNRTTLATCLKIRTMTNMEESSTPRQLGLTERPSSHCSKQ